MSVIEPMGSYLALVLVTAMQGDLAVDDTSVDSAGELTKPAFPWWETAMRHQGFQVLLGSSPAESTLTLLANSPKYPKRTLGRYNRVYWRYHRLPHQVAGVLAPC